MRLLIKDIKQFLQVREQGILKLSDKEMRELPFLENEWLSIEMGKILDFGKIEGYANPKVDEFMQSPIPPVASFPQQIFC